MLKSIKQPMVGHGSTLPLNRFRWYLECVLLRESKLRHFVLSEYRLSRVEHENIIKNSLKADVRDA